MKYLKLFENYKIDESEYPEDGYELSSKEKEILKDLVGDYYLKFNIKKDDGYYYTYYIEFYNRFDSFNDLRDYIQFRYIILYNKNINRFLELLKVTKLDMSFDINWPIRFTSGNGHTEVVKLLLEDPRVDPSAQDNYAIGMASEKGHTEVVKLLLADPRVDPSDDDNYAIKRASANGHTEIVKLLLQDPRVDPSDENNQALRWASSKRHIGIVKVLLNDERVRAKLSSEEINKYLNEIS